MMVNTEHGWRGGENQVLLLIRGLHRSHFHVKTICQEGGDLEHRLLEAGLDTLPIRVHGGFSPNAIREIRRAIRDMGAQLVHAHASHGHSLATIATIGLGIPLVVSRRVDFPISRNPFSKWKYRRAKRIVAVSDGVRQVLIQSGVSDDRIQVIHDGIDPNRLKDYALSKLRGELGIPGDALVFGITAFLTEHKDHTNLLHAFLRVEREIPNAWLLIAGEGELEGKLTTLSRELGLQRCRFLGFRPDVSEVLGALNVFVLSSKFEGLGSSVMDAMFLGLPVIATRAGGIPELIIDGIDGLLVPAMDPPSLAAGMIRLGRDCDLRERLGSSAREKASIRFVAPVMVQKYEELYRTLLSGDAGSTDGNAGSCKMMS